jgi:hypothetical protein
LSSSCTRDQNITISASEHVLYDPDMSELLSKETLL